MSTRASDISTVSTSENYKEGASKSNEDDACEEMNDMLQNMNMDDKDIVVPICANCGKEGDDNDMNTCNKCKQVKYCNAVCKKVHKKKHKKDCEEYQRLAAERRTDELRGAAELHDIELFKQPPPKEDCPICFQRLPTLNSGRRYMTCCGKVICSGCLHAPLYDNQGNQVDNKKCPFCRTPHPASNEELEEERYKKRVEANDPRAILDIGCLYRDGLRGFQQSYVKALEFYHRAAELGHTEAYRNVGYAYQCGKGVEVDKKKAIYYTELAAMRGDAGARHNLGISEKHSGNYNRALKHYTIAVRSGFAPSLNQIKDMYTNGQATKEDYTKALQLYQTYLGEIKSKQRDEAAAARV